MVRGVVTNAAGNPVVAATVGVNNFLLPCPANASALGIVDTQTNASGAYRIEANTIAPATTQCVAVTATPPGGTAQTVAGAQVQFKPTGSLPYDSVTVDIVVP